MHVFSVEVAMAVQGILRVRYATGSALHVHIPRASYISLPAVEIDTVKYLWTCDEA